MKSAMMSLCTFTWRIDRVHDVHLIRNHVLVQFRYSGQEGAEMLYNWNSSCNAGSVGVGASAGRFDVALSSWRVRVALVCVGWHVDLGR